MASVGALIYLDLSAPFQRAYSNSSILSFSNCKHLFLCQVYIDKGFGQMLTFPPNLASFWNLLGQQNKLHSQIIKGLSKSQLPGIIIKLFSIWATFHRQIYTALQFFEIKWLYYLDEIDFIRHHSSQLWDIETIVGFTL